MSYDRDLYPGGDYKPDKYDKFQHILFVMWVVFILLVGGAILLAYLFI